MRTPATAAPESASRRSRGAVAALLVAVTLTLGACTGDGEPVPGPTDDADPAPTTQGTPPAPGDAPTESVETDAADRDACALLPEEALTAALGEAAQPTAIPSDGWIAGQCTWSATGSGFILSVGTEESITAAGDPAEPDAAAKLAAYRDRAGQAGSAEDVAEIGDEAVVGPTGMAARVGGTYIEIEELVLTPEQLLEVGRLAVSNLGA